MCKVKMNFERTEGKHPLCFFLISVMALILGSCQKEAVSPDANRMPPTVLTIRQFQASASKVVLLQSNESLRAVNFSWSLNQPVQNVQYTVQAVVNGFSFDTDGVELGTVYESSFSISQKELNKQLLKIAIAQKASTIAFRVKVGQSHGASNITYSEPIAVVITPYQPVNTYEESQRMRISGNFQNWNLATAPAIVSAQNNGEYEGYVSFSNPYPQFLMVKGTQWVASSTFTYIGSNKIGFGGTVLSIFGGKGTYLVQANTNTNTWSYTKVSSWGLCGSAVKSATACQMDQVVTDDGMDGVWQVTADLQPGDFRIRANNDNTISFGKSNTEESKPEYKGKDFNISKAGNYTITLNIASPGNYYYGIQRNK